MDVQGAEARHPFVSLIDNPLGFIEEKVIETLYDPTGGIGEHRGLVVVAVSVQGIHLEIGPGGAVDVVALRIERHEIHQYHHRAARDLPTTNADAEGLLGSTTAPVGPQPLVFNEKGILLVLPEIRTNENNTVGHCILKSLSTGGKDGVDAAYFITDFPTGFKDVVGKESLLPHLPLNGFT